MGQQPLIAPPDLPGDRSTEIAAGQKSVVAACCINSAAMLQLADGDHYSDEQRAKFRTLNEHQAKALFVAAEIADETLVVLQDLVNLFDGYQGLELRRARAVIAKATGG